MSDRSDTRTEREYRMAQAEIMDDEQRREWEATRTIMRPPDPPELGIFDALAAFQSEVSLISKDGYNDFHRYHYASLEQWVDAIRPVLARHGLAIVTSCTRVEDLQPAETRKGDKLRMVRVTARATLYHRSGTSIAVDAYGEGSDSGDKAVYKAMTGARKYLLAALSGSATSDDPEHENEREASKLATPAKSKNEHAERGVSPRPQGVAKAASSGVTGSAPRSASPAPMGRGDDDGIPLSDAMLTLPYLDEPLGFGKHKEVAWRSFCAGGLSSGRISYLAWYLKQEHKTPQQEATAERAREVCRLVEEREMDAARAAQDAPPDSAWDDEPRLPEETRR